MTTFTKLIVGLVVGGLMLAFGASALLGLSSDILSSRRTPAFSAPQTSTWYSQYGHAEVLGIDAQVQVISDYNIANYDTYNRPESIQLQAIRDHTEALLSEARIAQVHQPPLSAGAWTSSWAAALEDYAQGAQAILNGDYLTGLSDLDRANSETVALTVARAQGLIP